MMITWLVITFATLVAGVLFLSWWRNRRSASLKPIVVDLDAFRMLLDRDDETYLLRKLPRGRFRKLKRQKIALTARYVSRISANVPKVLRDAQLKSESPDPEVAQQAVKTINLAIEIRQQCLVMYARLAAEYVMPSLQLTPVALASRYQTLRESVNRLRTLHSQRPALQGLTI